MTFLRRLKHEGKIKLIEPNTNLRQAFQERSRESLSSAKAVSAINNHNDAIVLSYYAMYHATLALFYRTGITCENHTAAIHILQDVFNIDATALLEAKGERIDKQYHISEHATEEESKISIRTAEEFISSITDKTARLTAKSIEEYRKRMQNYS